MSCRANFHRYLFLLIYPPFIPYHIKTERGGGYEPESQNKNRITQTQEGIYPIRSHNRNDCYRAFNHALCTCFKMMDSLSSKDMLYLETN